MQIDDMLIKNLKGDGSKKKVKFKKKSPTKKFKARLAF